MPATPSASRRALRLSDGRWIAGVCTGLAAHLNWPLALVRITFLVLTLANGLGLLAYGLLWVVMPLQPDAPRTRRMDSVRIAALAVIAFGGAIVVLTWNWLDFPTVAAPLLVLAIGLVILWQQWDSANQEPRHTWWRIARPILGIALVATALAALVVGGVGWIQGARALAAILLLVGGAALIASPWLLSVYSELAAERKGRIREQARAEMAAAVHDSVLQTLALIQRSAADPVQVRNLARTEERRLRSWLYSPLAPEHESLASAIAYAAARVEADHDAAVDVVTVGDHAMNEELDQLVAATREAIVNAARHTGTATDISVYCEVGDDEVSVYVRDRGPGFDPKDIASDRHGVRESIIGRMERIGGTAKVTSSATGTEVALRLEVAAL